MNSEKIGALIRQLRLEAGYTQRQLANLLAVSDKAVSKWETGAGCPDVSLLPAIAAVFGVNAEALLRGELPENQEANGNMKKTKFYVCPVCGNVLTAAGPASVSCCGRPLDPLEALPPDDVHDLTVEKVEDEWFVHSAHPMEREHYIRFVALVTGERLELVSCYPEWDLQQRFFRRGGGLLYWYCTQHGLFMKRI